MGCIPWVFYILFPILEEDPSEFYGVNLQNTIRSNYNCLAQIVPNLFCVLLPSLFLAHHIEVPLNTSTNLRFPGLHVY